jgi:monoamine oxidase
MIGTDISGGFEIFGSSDERYVIEGGNTRLIDELNKRLSGQSAVSQKLESIRAKGKGFTLSFDGSKEVDADILLLTIPFTMLREIEIKAELPDWKRKAINELGYGNHTKVMAGFTHAPWQVSGYAGEIFSDENFQLCWDNSGGNGEGLTSFTGGKKSIESGKGSVKFQADKFIGELDKIFPGTKDAANGKNTRFNWITYPFTKGSYSCYKPGQWTSIHGAESKPIGNLFFAGEHTSLDFQGFMNGGADSGKKAAEEIIALVK